MSKRTSAPGLVVRMAVLIAPLIFLMISFSGCIQTQLYKDIFFKEEDKGITWGVEEVVSIQYTFTDSYIVDTYADQSNFKVVEEAKWFILSVEITFHIVYASSLPDRLDFDPNPPREVRLFVTKPSGAVDEYTFENTGVVNLPPYLEPEPGLWRVRAEADGRGLAPTPDYKFYDNFAVVGRLNQPVD